VEDLKNQVSRHDHTHTEKGAELEQLRETIKSQKATIAELQKSLKEKEAVGEKALAAYKKKAQTSLAEANSRAAAANQAREDAELEASSARASVEDALKRARVAESSKDGVVAEAKKEVDEANAKLDAQSSEMALLRDELDTTKDRLQQLQGAAGSASDTCQKLEEELDTLTRELASEREKSTVLEQSYKNEQIKSQGYSDEVDTLRQELRQTATVALMEREKTSIKEKSASDGGEARLMSGKEDGTDGRMSEADATIIMLQQELAGANDAIRELKEALGNALVKSEADGVDISLATAPTLQARSFDSGDASYTQPTSTGYSTGHSGGAPPAGSGTGENDSTPLYFAMEKQFELNTARDEILRLANLLGDAESEKESAFEAMDVMRQKMEDAEAKLRRYEKLGAGAKAQLNSRYSNDYGGGYGSYRSSRLDDTEAEGPVSTAESQTNLEYLKNVMLSYLKAKSMAERKALVPVLASVLDFTPDEAYAAMENAEATSGLQGVGASFLETLGSKAHAFM
jgi:chromosome segregation ATPase